MNEADRTKITAPPGWHSSPVVHSARGEGYSAFTNGWGGWVAGFDLMGTPDLQSLPRDNVLYVFSMP